MSVKLFLVAGTGLPVPVGLAGWTPLHFALGKLLTYSLLK